MDSDSVCLGWAWDSAFLISSQAMPVLLAHRPHMRKQCCRRHTSQRDSARLRSQWLPLTSESMGVNLLFTFLFIWFSTMKRYCFCNQKEKIFKIQNLLGFSDYVIGICPKWCEIESKGKITVSTHNTSDTKCRGFSTPSNSNTNDPALEQTPQVEGSVPQGCFPLQRPVTSLCTSTKWL